MGAVEASILGLALAGGAFVLVEVIAKEPGALAALLRDAEAFARAPAPATTPRAAHLRLEIAGALAGAAAAASLVTTTVPQETPEILLSAAGTSSRIAAGTTHGMR